MTFASFLSTTKKTNKQTNKPTNQPTNKQTNQNRNRVVLPIKSGGTWRLGRRPTNRSASQKKKNQNKTQKCATLVCCFFFVFDRTAFGILLATWSDERWISRFVISLSLSLILLSFSFLSYFFFIFLFHGPLPGLIGFDRWNRVLVFFFCFWSLLLPRESAPTEFYRVLPSFTVLYLVFLGST